VARRIRADEAHLPQLRADLGPDPAPLHRFAERHDWDEIGKEFVRFCLEDVA